MNRSARLRVLSLIAVACLLTTVVLAPGAPAMEPVADPLPLFVDVGTDVTCAVTEATPALPDNGGSNAVPENTNLFVPPASSIGSGVIYCDTVADCPCADERCRCERPIGPEKFCICLDECNYNGDPEL